MKPHGIAQPANNATAAAKTDEYAKKMVDGCKESGAFSRNFREAKMRFRGEIQNEMAVESAKFTNFKLDASKPERNYLNGITLKI